MSVSRQSPQERCPYRLPDDEFTACSRKQISGFVEEFSLDHDRITSLGPVIQPILHAWVVLEKVEPDLALRDKEALTFHYAQLRSGQANVLNVCFLIPCADDLKPTLPRYFSAGVLWLWVQVQQHSCFSQRAMDFPQGVHDALQFYTSEGVREDGHLEALLGELKPCLGDVGHPEFHLATQSPRSVVNGLLDLRVARVKCED